MSKDLIMRKHLRYFVVFNREILISTVSDLLDNSGFLIHRQHLHSLLPVMYTADTALCKFFFKSCLFLTDICMW